MSRSKKIFALSALFVLILTARLFATGAGVQVSGNPSFFINQETVKGEQFTGRVIGTVRLGRLPVAGGLGFEAGKASADFAYGLTGFADYYALDLQIENTWNCYSGFGAEASLLTTDFKNWAMTAGARFFAGMNWLFWDNYLEVYVQQNVVPTWAKNFTASDSKAGFMLGLPLDAGIRFHF